jgi:hypothetical protein
MQKLLRNEGTTTLEKRENRKQKEIFKQQPGRPMLAGSPRASRKLLDQRLHLSISFSLSCPSSCALSSANVLLPPVTNRSHINHRLRLRRFFQPVRRYAYKHAYTHAAIYKSATPSVSFSFPRTPFFSILVQPASPLACCCR